MKPSLRMDRIANCCSSVPLSIDGPRRLTGLHAQHRRLSWRLERSFLQLSLPGIRSDLPGQITAQVTENVDDTLTGRARLVPQGARLIGVYDSQVAFGQSRVLLVWTRLIMPNGRSIVLERQPGADAAGYAGLEDDVDYHWKELIGAAALSTLLGVGSELGSGADNGSNTAILQALRLGAANSLNQTGQQVVRRDLNIQPTLTIRPGFPVLVIVNRDLVLEPYRG
jgi:type IV secretion system protein TrbI